MQGHPGLGRWDRELLPPALAQQIPEQGPGLPATPVAEGGRAASRRRMNAAPRAAPAAGRYRLRCRVGSGSTAEGPL